MIRRRRWACQGVVIVVVCEIDVAAVVVGATGRVVVLSCSATAIEAGLAKVLRSSRGRARKVADDVVGACMLVL